MPKKSKSLKNVETPEQLRAKFPKALINAFIKVSESDWATAEYELYKKEALKVLPENADAIDCGRLVVNLASATIDLRKKEKPNVQKVKEVQTKAE